MRKYIKKVPFVNKKISARGQKKLLKKYIPYRIPDFPLISDNSNTFKKYDCQKKSENNQSLKWKHIKKNGETEYLDFHCNQWRCECEKCQKKYYNNRLHKIQDIAFTYKMIFFWTLTLDPANIPGDTQERKVLNAWLYYIQDCWHKFMIEIKRKYPSFLFCSIREPQKNGLPHIHFLCNLWIPYETVFKFWKNCGGTSQRVGVFVEHLIADKNHRKAISQGKGKITKKELQKISFYLAKYMSKKYGKEQNTERQYTTFSHYKEPIKFALVIPPSTRLFQSSTKLNTKKTAKKNAISKDKKELWSVVIHDDTKKIPDKTLKNRSTKEDDNEIINIVLRAIDKFCLLSECEKISDLSPILNIWPYNGLKEYI